MLATAETSSVFAIRELCPRLPQCDVKGKEERRRNNKKPSTWRDSIPRPRVNKALALSLNHNTVLKWIMR